MGEIDRYLVKVVFTPAVVGYLVDGEKICLGVRKKVSLGLGENLIAGIGGKVSDEVLDETPEQAMDREVKEEIGVRVKEKRPMGRVRFMFAHKPPDSKWNQDVGILDGRGYRWKPRVQGRCGLQLGVYRGGRCGRITSTGFPRYCWDK